MKIFGVSVALIVFFSYVFFKRNHDLRNVNSDLKNYINDLTGDK